MKLDESIELKNKVEKTINEMKHMNYETMRSVMSEMANNEAMKGCMYEVLTMEGFLPETLSEGETYEEVMSSMMEDDEIMAEMYKACSMNESDCGSKMEAWLHEKLVGGQKELDKNDNGKIDATDFEMLRKEKGVDEMELNEYEKEVMGKFQSQYGKKRGKQIYYATANKQDRSPETFEKNEGEVYEGNYPEGEHYKIKVSQICDDLADVNKMMDGNDELPAWIQDKIAVMYHSADAIKSYLSGEKSMTMNEDAGGPSDTSDKLDYLEDLFSKVYKMGRLEAPIDFKMLAKSTVNDMFGDEEENTYEIPGFEGTTDALDNLTIREENEDDEDDNESPTYLLNKKRVLDQEIARYSKYIDKFIPMASKLDVNDLKSYFQPQGEFTVEGFIDFLTKKEEESAVDYYEKLNQTGEWIYRSVFDNLVSPRKRGFFIKFGNKLGMDTLEEMEDILSDIFDMGNNIYAKKKEIEKIESSIGARSEKDSDTSFDFDDAAISPKLSSKRELDVLSADALNLGAEDDDVLEEMNLPVKGKNIDSLNKTNSEKENSTATEDAEDSQETTEEKVDNLKNQKHELNSWEKNVDETMHGWRNNLDLDYRTGLDKDQSDRIKDQASGLAPEDHANVDHDSESGKKLIDASEKRAKDQYIGNNDYSSSHDRTQIDPDQTYEKTTVFSPVNEDIERLKALFSYEDNLVNENKKTTLDENEILFKQVSTKKFI